MESVLPNPSKTHITINRYGIFFATEKINRTSNKYYERKKQCFLPGHPVLAGRIFFDNPDLAGNTTTSAAGCGVSFINFFDIAIPFLF